MGFIVFVVLFCVSKQASIFLSCRYPYVPLCGGVEGRGWYRTIWIERPKKGKELVIFTLFRFGGNRRKFVQRGKRKYYPSF